MNAKTFIATNRNSISLAQGQANGNWSVDFLLVDKDVCCLAVDPLNFNVVYVSTQAIAGSSSDPKVGRCGYDICHWRVMPKLW